MHPIDRKNILSKLVVQHAALAAIIKLLSYQENQVETNEIINLQINISSTLDLLLNPITEQA